MNDDTTFDVDDDPLDWLSSSRLEKKFLNLVSWKFSNSQKKYNSSDRNELDWNGIGKKITKITFIMPRSIIDKKNIMISKVHFILFIWIEKSSMNDDANGLKK